MKAIPLPIAELKSALSGIGKVINPRTTLPLLQHVKVERTNDGWIALTGTDLDRFVTMRLEHPAEGPPCAVLVPYEQLQQLSKNCERDERLLIDITEQGPVIKFALADNLGETKVKPIPVAEFPETPRLKSEAIPLPPTLRTTIHEAMNCASTDSTRYVLNGTFIDASNPKGFYVVGTDGKHLYSANSFTLPIKNSLLIPNHKFLGWKEFNNDGEWQLRSDHEFVQVSSRRWRFISKQIVGKYPDWRSNIPNPETAKTHITIDPTKLESAVRLVQRLPSHNDPFHSIGLEWKNGQCLLLVKDTNEDPWTKVPMPDSKGEGPEVTVFINRYFLIKALQFGLNTISLISFVSPIRFHSKGRQMIVMPLRVEPGIQRPAMNKTEPDQPPPTSRSAPLKQPPPQPTMRPPAPLPSSEQKSPTEEAIDLTLLLRDKINEGFNLLRDLSLKLKHINREQKTSAKEMHSVRSTLRSIQGLKI